ncbi:MAG: NosD domain-containing protein [Candidatus Parvarchaeota archaeon]
MEGNYILDSGNGILISSVTNLIVFSNEMIGNAVGLDVSSSSNVTVYNNYFYNSNNAISSSAVRWNLTLRPGRNIIGGQYIGGNYWSNYAGEGTNGIGRTELPYNNNGLIRYGGDYLPLIGGQNFTLSLRSVNASYNSNVEIPVVVLNGTSFSNISETFSFDSRVLEFIGVLKDVSSGDVNFHYILRDNDTVTVDGTGYFDILSNETYLFYLVFRPLVTEQTITRVLLDNSTIGNMNTSQQSSSSVELSSGWSTLGPRNVSFQFGETPRMNGSGEVTDMAFSPYYPNIIYAGSGIKIQDGMGGIYRSEDGGNSWVNINMGLRYLSIEGIAVNPYDPYEVVIIAIGLTGEHGAIYKSINGGDTWQQTYPQGGLGLYVENSTIYAVTFTSILKSNDFGSTWTVLGTSGLTFPPGELQGGLILNGGKTIYLGEASENGGVDYLEYSNNSGSTFQTISSVITPFPIYQQIVADPSEQRIMWWLLWAGYSFDGLYYSDDSGRTWKQVNLQSIGLGAVFGPGVGFNTSPQFIAYDPLDPSVMFIGGDTWFYESHDGGSNFTHLVPGPNLDIRFIYPDPYVNGTIFVGSDQGLYVSRDYGKTWEGLNNRSTNLLEQVSISGRNIITNVADYSSIDSNNFGSSWYENSANLTGEGGVSATDPYNSSVMIFLNGMTFKVSNNGGSTFFVPGGNWNGLTSAVTTAPVAFKNGRTESIIVFSQSNPGYIFIAGGTGIFLSRDYGKTFYPVNGSPASCYSLAISGNGTLYAANSSGFYVSYNYGNGWILLNREFAGDNALSSLSVDPSDGNILAGATNWAGITDVYISRNGGRSFYYANMSSEYIFPAPGAVLFLNSSNQTVLIFMGGDGVFVSYDLGQEWVDKSYNLNEESSVTSMTYINGTAFISTWGEGVLYNPQLLNNSYVKLPPLLTYYLPRNATVTVNGEVYQKSGYSSIIIRDGNNTIMTTMNGKKAYENITATAGSVYFINFGPHNVPVTFVSDGIPRGTAWNVSVNGTVYSFSSSTGTVNLLPGTYELYIEPVATDYSIYFPDVRYLTIEVSYNPVLISVQFKEMTQVSYFNMTPEMKSAFWTTQISYDSGYVFYGGGGNAMLLDTSTNSIENIGNPFPNGQIYAVSAFNNGFLVSGSISGNRPGISYYNISSGIFQNLSGLIPSGWNGSSSKITSIFRVNNYTFGFIGGAIGKVFFALVDNGTLLNLTPYLPSNFIPPSGQIFSYSGAFLSSDDSIILSDSTSFGLLYLGNRTFRELDSQLGYSVYLGLEAAFTTSFAFIASDGSEAMIIGTDQSNGLPFAATYSPSSGLTDVSSLFPSTQQLDTVTWNGEDFVVSGMMANGSAPMIDLYDPYSGTLTTLNTSFFGNIYLVDSAIMEGGIVYFTTFNSKPIPNTTYVVDFSYYGEMKPTATGKIHIEVNVPSTIEIGNQTFYGQNFWISEFSGNYSINVSSIGFKTVTEQIYVPPLGSIDLHFNLTSRILYNVSFNESGLPVGTEWYVNLSNGMDSGAITGTSYSFSLPNGTYSYTIATIDKTYSPSSPSGSFTVNGAALSESVTFMEVVYTVTFAETGLTAGTSWSVTLGATTQTSNTNTITFTEPNGSYSYSISGISGYRANAYTGTVMINGSSVSISVVWSVITYPITISETGIPSGTSWTVTLSGTAFNGNQINTTLSSTTNSITFNEPNGSYSFTAHLPSGYTSSSAKGSITVSGTSATAKITIQSQTNYLSYIIVVVIVVVIIAAVITVTRRKK